MFRRNLNTSTNMLRRNLNTSTNMLRRNIGTQCIGGTKYKYGHV
jgi:hypothetical protein